MKREKCPNWMVISLIAVLAAGAANPPAQPASQEIAEEPSLESIEGTHLWTVTRELPFDRGGSLRVRNGNGEVTITTWDEPKVRVQAEKWMRVRRGGFRFLWFHSKGKIPFKAVQEAEDYFRKLNVEISGSSREVVVETEFPKRKKNVGLAVDYEICLPREAAVDLRTSNGKLACTELEGALVARTSNGEIVVRKVRGEINLSSTNGELNLEDLTGTVVADTSNGAISCNGVVGVVKLETSNGRIELLHPEPVSASESITCRTSNGPIHLSLGPGSSFELEAETSNGHVSTDFPVTTQGKISSKHLSGKVGQGGSEVKLRTSNGSISIKRR